MSSSISLLFLCTVLHFTVDGVCAAVMAKYAVNEPDFTNIVYYFSLYNIIAFGGQWLAGLILDKRRSLILPSLCLVPLLLAGGLVTRSGILFQAVSVALGNCIFHVAAGILILERYSGFREPGIFVSSGAVGLGLGLHRLVPASVFEIVCVVGTVSAVWLVRRSPDSQPVHCEDSSRGRLESLLAGAVLLLVCVVLRGFGGSTRIPEHVMLMPCVFMLGKSAGGILCDVIGFRKTILAIFIMCFAGLQLSGLTGIITLTFAFNMTMPLTLRLLHMYFPDYPGLTFGLAAGCLLPGAFLKHSLSISPDIMAVVQFVSLFIAGYIFMRWGKGGERQSLQQ